MRILGSIAARLGIIYNRIIGGTPVIEVTGTYQTEIEITGTYQTEIEITGTYP